MAGAMKTQRSPLRLALAFPAASGWRKSTRGGSALTAPEVAIATEPTAPAVAVRDLVAVAAPAPRQRTARPVRRQLQFLGRGPDRDGVRVERPKPGIQGAGFVRGERDETAVGRQQRLGDRELLSNQLDGLARLPIER